MIWWLTGYKVTTMASDSRRSAVPLIWRAFQRDDHMAIEGVVAKEIKARTGAGWFQQIECPPARGR